MMILIGHYDSPFVRRVAVALRAAVPGEAHPDTFVPQEWPALAAHARACEALPEFAAVVMPFSVVAPKP